MEQRINHMEYMPGMEIIESDVMEQVISKMDAYDCEKYTANDVLIALKKDVLDIEDFAALLSPAALPLLEEMAKRAKLETRKHFGNSVYANEKNRINRLMIRDEASKSSIKHLMKFQLDEKKKMEMSDFVIMNNKSLEELKVQADFLSRVIKALAK